jgi:hypothetical protein
MADPGSFGPRGNDMIRAQGLTEAARLDARHRSSGAHHGLDRSRWPSAGDFVRRLSLVIVATVALGWILTALSGGA